MKRDIADLRAGLFQMMNNMNPAQQAATAQPQAPFGTRLLPVAPVQAENHTEPIEHLVTNVEEEPLSLQEKEKQMIKKALLRHKGKRKDAAAELGISERTLYRKIKENNLEEL